MMPYERFDAWRACHEMAIGTYRVTNSFPKHELYGLASQSELSYAGRLAKDLEYLSAEQWREFDNWCSRAGKLTMGLYKAMSAKRPP